MAALSVLNPSLLDLATMTDPNGQIATVGEILNETNEILDDMSWQEGNLQTGHRSVMRTGLPAPTWRKLYGGVAPQKSTYAAVTDGCGQLAAYSEADMELAKLSGNVAQFRMNEARGQIEGMNQEFVDTLFFGNAGTEPEAFTGLAPRFNSLSASNAENIIDATGSGSDNTSIWLVYWHPTTIFGIVPKGSQAGLQVVDKGQVTIEDASNGSNTGRMEGYRTYFSWHVGLHVKDWRAVVRIANIDKSLTLATGATGPKLADLMFQALEVVPRSCAIGRPAFYMSRYMMTRLRQQLAAAVSSSTLSIEDVGGRKVTAFSGVPLRRCDALAPDETAVA